MSTPTIALYTRQDYDREMDATLLAADAEGLVLDQTVFYPRGGNQDGDTGVLARRDAPDAAPLAVVEVLKDDQGVIHHHVAAPSAWPPGTPVHGTLDWPRRFLLMRLHTAQHLISRWFLDHGDNATERVDITESGCIIEFARLITLDDALACQADLNRLIRTGRAVRRINTGGYLEIEVDRYDRQPCGGTHVSNVGEIEVIALTRVRRNRLEFQVAEGARQVQQQMAAAVLALAPDLDADVAGFGAKVRAAWDDLKAARAALYALREEVAEARIARALAASPAVTLPGDPPVAVYALDLEGIDSKQVPRLLKNAQGPGRLFLCLSAGRNLVVVSGAPGVPAGELVRRLTAAWGVRGGGSPAVAQCGPLPAEVGLGDVVARAAAD
jgi:Ser-tRNA(Ala) deacylase AlaX